MPGPGTKNEYRHNIFHILILYFNVVIMFFLCTFKYENIKDVAMSLSVCVLLGLVMVDIMVDISTVYGQILLHLIAMPGSINTQNENL